MRLALAIVGFTSTLAQLLLMREIVASFLGNELLFGLVLMMWMAWVAVGAWGLGRLLGRRAWGQREMAIGLAVGGCLAPAEIALLRGNRHLLGLTLGVLPEFGSILAFLLLVLAPLCLLMGYLFTLGAKLMVASGEAAGLAYSYESLGAVLGAASYGFLLVGWLDTFQIALLLASTGLPAGGWLMQGRPWTGRWKRLRFALLFLLLGAIAILLGKEVDSRTLAWQWGTWVFAGDSRYGRIVVQARDGQRSFFVNGMLSFETQSTFSEEVVHVAMLAHPNPGSVLLIGGGVAGDLREILSHPVHHVTYAELDPLLVAAAEHYLPPDDARVLVDRRVDIVLSDGRTYVARKAEQVGADDSRVGGATETTPGASSSETGSFDVILVDVPEPSTGGLNRFYTREFFLQTQRILKSGGILSLGLPSAENYWSPELARRNASIYWTLKSVFRNVIVLPGEHNFLLASDTPLETNPIILAERLAERGVQPRWVTPTYLRYVFETDRYDQIQAQLQTLKSVRINQDMAPICYYYDLVLWLSRFYPGLRSVFERAESLPLGWFLVPLAVMLAVARRWRSLSVPLVVGAIGLAQMSLQIAILFIFQAVHGTLYAQVNLIVTAFMAGMVLGSLLAVRVVSRVSEKAAMSSRRILIGLLVGNVTLVGFLLLVSASPVASPGFVFPLVSLVAGGLGGAAFPLALQILPREKTGRDVGTLYGADLLGGCVGALVTSLLLVPLLGMVETCLAIAAVSVAAALTLVG